MKFSGTLSMSRSLAVTIAAMACVVIDKNRMFIIGKPATAFTFQMKPVHTIGRHSKIGVTFSSPSQLQQPPKMSPTVAGDRALTRVFNNNNNSGDNSNKDEEEKDDLTIEEHSLDWNTIVRQTKLFWEMSFPFLKESKSGRLLFFGLIGLTILNSGISVAFSYLGKDFWNALSSKNESEFYGVLLRYVPALLAGAPIVTYYGFQREQLANSWREWMTERTLEMYSNDRRVYYSLERGQEIDNPDQRIAEDVKTFTQYSLTLFITIIRSIVDLGSFSLILWSIYPQLFFAIIAYAAFGTITTSYIGKNLIGLNFKQLQKEADFRFSLVRLRENSESIAFYNGEELEGNFIRDRFKKVVDNTNDVNVAQRNLEFFTNGYRYIISILPIAVVAPRYFAGAIELGAISQSAGAFSHILNDVSIIINQFESLSSFSAGIDRLSQFYKGVRQEDPYRNITTPLLQLVGSQQPEQPFFLDAEVEEKLIIDSSIGNAPLQFGLIQLRQMDPVHLDSGKLENNANDDSASIDSNFDKNIVLDVRDLDLCTPDRKRTLIRGLSLSLKEGTNLLIVGSSGAGKSSLLRGVAGLWTAGNGIITKPSDSDVYFLPQRPYCTVGSLKDQLLYPSMETEAEANEEEKGSKKEKDDSGETTDNNKRKRRRLDSKIVDDDYLLQVLEKVDLKELAIRVGDGDPYEGLRAEKDWSNTLSLGEQQRLAFGRLLVNKPRLVILDEATSALDMVAEARMYTLLQNMARKTAQKNGILSPPGLTYISVGHRPSLVAFHDQKLRLSSEADSSGNCKHEITNIEKSGLDTSSVGSFVKNL